MGAAAHAAGAPGARGDLRGPGGVLLLSVYELGHPPHGLAVPMAFLERAGFSPAARDLSVQQLDADEVRRAGLVVLSVPMHTALRLGVEVARQVRALSPGAAICFAGLYAPLNAAYLRELGADQVLGGEWEAELVRVAEALAGGAPGAGAPRRVVLDKLAFPRPSRRGLPGLSAYARLERADGSTALAGYAETTRGCREMCRHCPVPPVYGGRLFALPADAVLEDIAAQVEAGAGHITFGDPDFFNGPRHGMRILERMHARWPGATFDITTQVAHLCRRSGDVARLGELGCAFVVTAVESLSDEVLARLDKRHRRADVDAALAACERAGLAVRPTFVPFSPWASLADLVDLVEYVAERGLAGAVDPVQLSVRLLVPPGSLLLEDPASRRVFGPLDRERLTHAWRHADPRMDALQAAIERLVGERAAAAADRGQEGLDVFQAVRALVREAAGLEAPPALAPWQRRRVPRVTEPWFC